MKEAINYLDDVPLASVATVIVLLAGLYAFVTGQISYIEFGAGSGAGTVGAAAVGHVRNKANKGIDFAGMRQTRRAGRRQRRGRRRS